MSVHSLRLRFVFGAFWVAVVVAVFATFLAASHVMVGTGQISYISHHDGDGRDGNSGGDYGNGNDQRHCHESENCRGSFSPGPFDRSPVDVHDNCISLDCSGRDPSKKQPPAQGKASLTDPAKLPMVIAGIIKSSLDLGRMFADGTITFVENMLLALA